MQARRLLRVVVSFVVEEERASHLEFAGRPARGGTRVLRSHWNALTVGDRVLVHDPDDPTHALVAGVIMAVDVTAGANVVDVKLPSNGKASRTVRPPRLTVHSDPVDLDEECWRCDRPRR